MLHIYPLCGIFYLPSNGTGTRGRQFNVASKRQPAGRGSNPGPSAQQASVLTTRPPREFEIKMYAIWQTIIYTLLEFEVKTSSIPGPLASALSKRIGCRATLALGGFISSVGFGTAAFTNSINGLLLTMGLTGGIYLYISIDSKL